MRPYKPMTKRGARLLLIAAAAGAALLTITQMAHRVTQGASQEATATTLTLEPASYRVPAR